jgi:hypothetical protein
LFLAVQHLIRKHNNIFFLGLEAKKPDGDSDVLPTINEPLEHDFASQGLLILAIFLVIANYHFF